MKEKHEEIRQDIANEIKAIDEVLERLINLRQKYIPGNQDYSLEPAMGTYLMNFYNGRENILKRVSKEYYLDLPSGPNWHKDLLTLAFNPPAGKVAMFSENMVEKLHAYRNFRHRFISGYGFQLKAEKMMGLIDNVDLLWQEIKQTITVFLVKI